MTFTWRSLLRPGRDAAGGGLLAGMSLAAAALADRFGGEPGANAMCGAAAGASDYVKAFKGPRAPTHPTSTS